MDRLIAFGAGAVLAFGLGYLVSYQVNCVDPDVDAARQELEATGDDGAGLVDSKPPKLKALADLANQGDDAITKDLAPAEIRDLKNMLLPHLTPADIASWPSAREAYITRFLSESQGPWACGSDEKPAARFDASLAREAEGHYQGKITLTATDKQPERVFDTTLELKDFKSKSPEGRVAMHKEDGTPFWGLQFRWKQVGTDPETRSVYVVFPAFAPEVSVRTTHLALAIPAGLEARKAATGDLLGLTPDLTWARVGTFELLKND